MYEMFTGSPPYTNVNKAQLMSNIVSKGVPLKKIKNASSEFKSIIKGFLQADPDKRLGSKGLDAKAVRKHPYFRPINWEELAEKQVQPPFKPETKNAEDTSNIHKVFLKEKAVDTPVQSVLEQQDKERNYFDNFTFSRESLSDKAEDGVIYPEAGDLNSHGEAKILGSPDDLYLQMDFRRMSSCREVTDGDMEGKIF